MKPCRTLLGKLLRALNFDLHSARRLLASACWILVLASAAQLPLRAGVLINEFMYQPASYNTNEEWIELWNHDTNSVDLTGWRFTRGIDFTFTNGPVVAAGEYVVIAANTATFAANYPAVAASARVYGPWRGTLRNNGDTIRLEDSAGNRIDEVTYATEGDWGQRIRGVLQANFRGWDWTCAHDGTDRSAELINPLVKKNSGQNWSASTSLHGTPGAVNSTFSTNTAPLILDVAHAPLVPASTNPITISTRIVDALGAGPTVRLRWRLDANPQGPAFGSTVMFDDGAHGDGLAADGVYAVVLPPQTNLAIIEFYVEAVSASGKTNTWPAPVLPAIDGAGPSGQVANALLQVDNTPYTDSAPLYRILMTAAEKAERDAIASAGNQTDAQMNATLISIDGAGSDLRYLCGMRPRGAGSRGSSTGRAVPNQRVNVPNDRPWKGVRHFNLNSQYTHSQAAGYALASKAGLVTEAVRVVKVKINGVDNANAGAPQYGYYTHTEVPNSDFVDAHFPLDNGGNLYRMSDGSHRANLGYRGPLYTSYSTVGYLKQNNTTENDWSDLINLTWVLTNAPDATYAQQVRQVANVEQWMLYFATYVLTESEETSLANGCGDDYAAYRGGFDPRFMLVAHDWDTILGQGDTGGQITRSIWKMVPAVMGVTNNNNNTVALNRFMLHPEFAPIYFATLKRLLDTTFSNEQLARTLDEVLGAWVPGSVITAMKTFATNRNAYVLSQIPTELTATSSLTTISGYPQTTVPGVTLFGRADAIRTRSVLVNGTPATWIAWQARWTNTVTLNPGINRVLVQSLDSNGVEFARATYDVWYDTGASTGVSGALVANTTWSPASGPYVVTGNLTVPAGVTLTIQPGTSVQLVSGATVTVLGQLLAEGTDTQRIRFTRVPGSSSWGSLDFVNTGATESRLRYVDFEGAAGTTLLGRAAQVHVNASRVLLDHCSWPGTPSQTYIAFDSSSFVVQNCVFPTYASAIGAPTMLVGTNGIPSGGYGILRDNYFGRTFGTSDTVDFNGGNRPAPILQVIGNVFDGAGDEQLNLDSTDARIEGNIFMHVHRDATRLDDPLDTASAISGGVTVPGQYSEWTIVNNLFYDADHAVLAKQGNRFSFMNNTVSHIATEGGSGQTTDLAVFNFNDRGLTPAPASAGGAAYIANNILSDTPRLVANYSATNLTVVLQSNLLSTAWTGPGSNNVVADPRLNLQLITNVTAASWQNVKAALTPRAGSLALGRGWGSKYDIGALQPHGIMITGEPAGATANSFASLRVMPSQVPGLETVPSLVGYTSYRWKLDGGAWSAELSTLSQPTISLNGLTPGPHTVYVVGKTDAGYFQDDPFVYPTNANVPAQITASRTWMVTNLAGTVRLNEVLAWNSGVVTTNGDTPDLIEIYNPGATAYDLSGVGVTDDPGTPYRFTFPAGTTLAPGQFLVLFADADKSAAGFHLGFALNQNGQTVQIFASPAQGGGLLDQVSFGVQLPDFSVARAADGAWGLAVPTLGAPNVLAPVANPTGVRINEWLAAPSIGSDFIELLNTESVAADLGGSFMSDAPAAAPGQHVFPPLTFIGARSYLVLDADGNAEQGANHVGFKLSADRGEIGLFSPDFAVIDWVLYGPQSLDVSEGRTPDGASARAFFSLPTPGAPNPGGGNILVTVSNTFATVFGIEGKSWRYEASGTDLGTAWRASGYNDSTWLSGVALFGRETSPGIYSPYTFQTVVPSPSQGGPITAYYRTRFTWPPAGVSNSPGWVLWLTNLVDDGAVFYLNGTEIARLRVTANPVLFTSFAQNSAEPAFDVVAASPTNLVVGENVLAVEVHQADSTSSDHVFGMGLGASKSTTNVLQIAVVLNEVMANNHSFTNADGSVSDWIEIYNPTTNALDLADMSLSDDVAQPRRWVFPAGVVVPPGAYLKVAFDSGSAPSTNASGALNTGFGFAAGGDQVLLFDSQAKGGGLLDSVKFGLQAADFSIGRVPNGTGAWTLTLPTERSLNIAAALGNPALVRVNEWMPDPRSGDDWFELYNPNAQPVSLGGYYLTDNLNNRTQYRIPALSFLGVGLRGFVQFFADAPSTDKGADHTNFKLSAAQESVGLFAPDGVTLIDAVSWTNAVTGVSEGRFPDGAATVVKFVQTPTPGRANFLPFNDLVINEVLTHSDPPLEDAIELFNPTATPIDIGGWFLSDSQVQPKKYRFAENTLVQAGGFVVVYENQFNPTPGLGGSFALSSGEGDNIHLSVADLAGNLTGYRVTEDFGAQENGVTFGRYETSIGYDFVAMSARTFGVDNPATLEQFRTGLGATNPAPRVGPIVINEIHYHPPDVGTNDNTAEEFIELYNTASTNVALFDPAAPTNTWHVRNAVEFDFPAAVTMAPRSYLLLVGFDPATNASATAAFRAKYAIDGSVPIYGPLSGKLANDEDNVELRRPDTPNANEVPYILVEKVHYRDMAPWPAAADWNTTGANGVSLQRLVALSYANDPTNWLAGLPTAGATNGAPFGARPFITAHPASRVANVGSNVLFTISAAGGAPLSYQWRFNGVDILNATNTVFTVTNAQYANVGRYSVRVMNPFGAALSTNAVLSFGAAPEIVFQPQSRASIAGSNVSFAVGARGAQPLGYQWRKDGALLNGATTPVLTLSNVQTNDAAAYTVVISNSFGSVTSDVAFLTFNAPPIIVAQPQSTNAFVGGGVTFAATVVGSVPMRFQWRFNGANIGGATNASLTLTNLQTTASGSYTLFASNAFGTAMSSNAALVVTIPPTITIVASDPTASEAGLEPGQFTIRRSVTSNTAITVNLTVSGTAQNGGDCAVVPNSVFMGVGVTSVVVNVSPIDDSAAEAQETIVLAINPSSQYAVGVPNSATVTILDNDNQLPTVALTAPANGSVYPASPTNIFISATASDPDGGVAKVEFIANGTNKIGEVLGSGPFGLTWVNASPGSNVLVAVASDVYGATAASAPVGVYVNGAPMVGITAPVDGSSVPQGDVEIAASASDYHGTVTRVDFYFGGNFLRSVSNAPYSVLLTNLPLGSYEAQAVAYDNFGVSAASPLTHFTVVIANTNFADMFAERGFVTGLTNFSMATNTSATFEPGEQTHANTGGRSMWLTWIAPAAGVVTIDLFQSSFDTLMAVYTNQPGLGPNVSNIVKVVQNDDSNVAGTNATRSRVVFTNTEPGRAYHIAADGWRGANGLLQMHLSLSNTSPYITTQPVHQTNNIGTSATFTVAATGVAPIAYFWRFNGAPIAGANGSSFTVNNIQTTNNGVYDVIVSNSFGIAISAGANLVVRSTPIITQQPQSQTVSAGQSATFTVVAQGGSLTYQWRFNGANISGANGPTYVRPNVGTNDVGSYTCYIVNGLGNVTSDAAQLSIALPLRVSASSYSNGVFYGVLNGGPLNRGYMIEVSTNFVDGWSALRTITNVTGTASWTDTNSAPTRKYRARLLP